MTQQTKPVARPQHGARPATPEPSPEAVKINVPGSVPPPKQRVIVLEYPVTFAGMDYHQLTVRRLKARDFRQLDVQEGGGNAAAIAMAALVCGVDEAIIDELDATDYIKVQEAIADFFPKALVDKLSAPPSAS